MRCRSWSIPYAPFVFIVLSSFKGTKSPTISLLAGVAPYPTAVSAAKVWAGQRHENCDRSGTPTNNWTSRPTSALGSARLSETSKSRRQTWRRPHSPRRPRDLPHSSSGVPRCLSFGCICPIIVHGLRNRNVGRPSGRGQLPTVIQTCPNESVYTVRSSDLCIFLLTDWKSVVPSGYARDHPAYGERWIAWSDKALSQSE